MESVAIYPVTSVEGATAFRAVARTAQSEGRTPGEALDAISGQRHPDSSGTVVVIQPFHPDCFFDEQQQLRLTQLMSEWRATRDQGIGPTAEKRLQLETLIGAETLAARDRSLKLVSDLGQINRYSG